MSVANNFSVPLFLNHSNDTVPETIVTVKSRGCVVFAHLVLALSG